MKHRSALNASVLCITLSLSAAASAAFLPYRVLLADFGGVPGIGIGQPITWTGPGDNTSFTSPVGGLLPPNADNIDASPRVRWDNYFMFDPNGASVGGDPSISGDGYSALAPSGSFGPAFGAGIINGVIYNVESTFGGRFAGADGRLYLLNVTLRAGSSVPTTAGIYTGVVEGTLGQFNNENYLPSLKFGRENAVFGVNPISQRRYYLDWIATPVAASELPPSFGAGINYQIYIQQLDPTIPSPGTVSLAMIAATFVRRKR